MSRTSSAPGKPGNGDLAGFHELKGKRLALMLVGLMMGMFLSSLDQTVVSTAMPSVIASLNGLDRYAWVFTSYMVTATAGMLIFGKLSDLYGRKWLYIGGIALFLLGSAMSGASQTMDQLIAFRAFQGVGAGIMMSISFAIIGDVFPPAERGKWMGLFSGVFALASVLGPTIGGYITDNWSWRWVFYINLPLGAAAMVALAVFLPYFRDKKRQVSVDYLGVVLLLFTAVPLLVAVSLTGTGYGWGSPLVAGLLALSVAALAAFLWAEDRAREPILRLGLFKTGVFSISVAVAFFTTMGMFAATLFIPLFVQGVIGKTATGAGNVLMPMMLGVVAGSIFGGQAMSRTGKYRVLGVVGLTMAVVGMYLLTRMGVDTGMGTAIRNIVILGMGIGITMPVFTIAVQNAFSNQVLGQVTSSVQFFRGVGAAVGSAIFGSLFVQRFHSALLTRVPAPVAQAVNSGELPVLSNPRGLSGEPAQAALQQQLAQYGAGDPAAVQGILDSIRASIAAGLHDVFVIGTILVALSCLIAIFMKEVPLRRRDLTGAASPATRKTPPGAAKVREETEAGPALS